MNYELSAKILKEIEGAKKILLNCHRNPDPDSIGSALALKEILLGMGKEVKVICPTKLDKGVSFLKGFNEIEVVDFEKFEFKKYDLFITTDSSSWGMVSGNENIKIPKLPIVIIDHHHTNKSFGKINLIDFKVTSASELLFKVFSDWGVKIGKESATALLAGIISDTGAFRYIGVGVETLKIATDLIEMGGDKDKIVMNLFNNLATNQIKLLGIILSEINIDEKYKFVWTAIDYQTYKKYGEPDNAKEYAANTFMESVKDTRFGVIMMETQPKRLTVSFRSRKNIDVSKIALALGGGGHKVASGATVSGLEFRDAVEKVLQTAREIANENRA